jgi:[acyl-carrier-protein] S-malonyltransferase
MGSYADEVEFIDGGVYMSKIAFIFPGQGAQYVGMGKDIAESYAEAGSIFDQASEALGYDMREMVFSGDAEKLMETEITQPAILTTSIACLQPFLLKGIIPDMTAGLSLGEYTAHVLSGTMSFKDAVRVTRKRGKYMQEAVPFGKGGMAAIMGLSDEDVIECCREASKYGVVEPANFNCPGQIVAAGEVQAVEKMAELCKQKGAKKVRILPVSAPFHTSLLKHAGEKLAAELEKIEIRDMKIPVVSNVTGDFIRDKSEVKDLLIKQVSSPVLWEKSVRRMIEEGADTFVEIGPGKALTGFIKRIDGNVRMFNVENLESLNNTLESLGV